MKRSMIGFALTLVMAFGISSCGKSGGGGSSNGIGTSLLTSGNLDVNGQQVATSLNNWIQGTETISQPGQCGSFNVVRSNTSGNSTGNNNCQQGQWLGFIDYTYCSGSGSGSQGTAQPAVLTTVNCVATVRSSYGSIQGILGTGTMVQAQQVSQTAYKVVMQRANSTFVTYVIDTALPAAFQPMISHDSATGIQSSVTGIQLAY